jgi:hypothetical protein
MASILAGDARGAGWRTTLLTRVACEGCSSRTSLEEPRSQRQLLRWSPGHRLALAATGASSLKAVTPGCARERGFGTGEAVVVGGQRIDAVDGQAEAHREGVSR